jgi:hypothetical protein
LIIPSANRQKCSSPAVTRVYERRKPPKMSEPPRRASTEMFNPSARGLR